MREETTAAFRRAARQRMGEVVTFDEEARRLEPGQPLWAVFSRDEESSSLWPPRA